MKTRLIICGLFCLLTATSLKATENKVGIDLYESGMIGAAKAFFLTSSLKKSIFYNCLKHN